jgi:hypothetical protein
MQTMAQNQVNSIVATTSGIFGGLSKAILLKVVITAISLQTIFEVAVYASVSAIVGYGIKLIIDLVSKLFKSKE